MEREVNRKLRILAKLCLDLHSREIMRRGCEARMSSPGVSQTGLMASCSATWAWEPRFLFQATSPHLPSPLVDHSSTLTYFRIYIHENQRHLQPQPQEVVMIRFASAKRMRY
jgi:hypothetical protein